MKHADAVKLAAAYFVIGATSTPLSSAVLDVSAWKLAAAAGIAAVIDFGRRVAQAYIADRKAA